MKRNSDNNYIKVGAFLQIISLICLIFILKFHSNKHITTEAINIQIAIYRNKEFQTREANMSALNTSNDKYDIKRIQKFKIHKSLTCGC